MTVALSVGWGLGLGLDRAHPVYRLRLVIVAVSFIADSSMLRGYDKALRRKHRSLEGR